MHPANVSSASVQRGRRWGVGSHVRVSRALVCILLLFYESVNRQRIVLLSLPPFPSWFHHCLQTDFCIKVAFCFSCVCSHVCVFITFWEKGGKKMLIVTSVLLSLIALCPLSLCSHRVPLHLPPSLWLFYFVFQWTFIAPLNLNPPLSPCTGYSLLPSNFLYAFPYTNCQFSHTRHLYSVAHYDFLLPLASPLCVQLDIIVPLYSVFWIGK